MNNDIFALIDAAKEQMKQIGLAEAMIETYQLRSFNQIIQQYQKEGDYQYRQEIMHQKVIVEGLPPQENSQSIFMQWDFVMESFVTRYHRYCIQTDLFLWIKAQ